MNVNEQYMQRCIMLAVKGLGDVAPNPMVGCVIAHEGKIIGEGYHQKYGEPHAEVNAINSVTEKELLSHSTLYVSLEPCAHQGKTPPCADLIIKNNIPSVVIGSIDPNPLVKGKGIEKLLRAGISVDSGILEKECRELNKRFFTFHEKKRPYIILKWAQTADGFIDKKRNFGDGQLPLKISNDETKKLSLQWRSEEQAIMVGANTALLDDPKLTARKAGKKDPLRVLIDRDLKIPAHYHLLDDSVPTMIFTSVKKRSSAHSTFVNIDFSSEANVIAAVLGTLHKKNIQSLIVEGGTTLLDAFFEKDLWDEARIIISPLKIDTGVPAPVFHEKNRQFFSVDHVDNNEVKIYRHT